MVIETPDIMDSEQLERHSGGRHLDATRDDVLREAALQLLADIGYDRVTVEKIAAIAGAGKATIYRRWSGKAELVVDALMCAKASVATPNTGSLEGDLNELAHHADEGDRRLDTQVMIGLVSALPHDEELREAFRERLVEPHMDTLRVVFERAVERGEIMPVANLDTLVAIIPALVLHRLLVFGTAPDTEFFESLVHGVILPLVRAGSSSSANPPTPSATRTESD